MRSKNFHALQTNGFQKPSLVMWLNVWMIFINSESLFRFICSGTQINTFCLRYWVILCTSCLGSYTVGQKPCSLFWDYSIYQKRAMMMGFSNREYCALVFLCLVTFSATGRKYIHICGRCGSLLQIAQFIRFHFETEYYAPIVCFFPVSEMRCWLCLWK